MVSSRQMSWARRPLRPGGEQFLHFSPRHNQGVPTCVSVGTSVTGRVAASHLTIGHGGRILLADEQMGAQRWGSLSGVTEGVPLGCLCPQFLLMADCTRGCGAPCPPTPGFAGVGSVTPAFPPRGCGDLRSEACAACHGVSLRKARRIPDAQV